MLYNVFFDVAAVLLDSMLILIIYLRRTYPTKTCAFYKGLLWLNLISSMADIVSAHSISYPEAYSLSLTYTFNVIYLLAHNLTAVVFLLYVIMLIRGNIGLKWERICWITAAVSEQLLILTTPMTEFVIYFDEEMGYHHGIMMPFIYGCTFAILIYAMILFIRHRGVMNSYQRITNISFLILIMASVILQYFYPEYLIESYCTTISLLMMNVALDNPAVFFYKDTDVFNQNAFDTTLETKLKNEPNFTVVAFDFDDLPIFRKKYGDAAHESVTRETLRACHKFFGRERVYLLSSGAVALYIGRDDVQDTVDALSEFVGKDLRVGEETMELTPHFCVFRHMGVPETVSDVNDSIENMLYDIYRQTGERIIFNDTQLLESKHREATIIHRLRNAIRDDGFDVFYQPILDVASGRFYSAEALVRLSQRDGGGFVGPDEFIPIAEKNGMILEIGEIVLEKACRFWKEENLGDYGIEYIEVNLSMVQLLKRSAVERLEAIVDRYGIEPRHINFEITETASASEGARASINDCINYLCSKGFSFSLDDYGSGYSTVTYLADMPFHIIKIDKGILWSAMRQSSFRVVLTNTVKMVHDLGKVCLAEGVENEEMATVLGRLGCDASQGYLYSKPIAAPAFLEFLKKNQKIF